jgi:hypothetical protein
MEGWTSQSVLQLAPDPASGKAGQGLASPRKWPSLGHDGEAVWGECQGSGAKPYQVQVELAGPTFKCSCPSRKFPCKHGLGLMLMYAAGQLTAGARPAWVAEWLASRAERAEKKQAKAAEPPKPVDEAAQAKRRERRQERVGDGLASLKVWLTDLVRGGVATVPTRGYGFFDDPARRMVDAQAPGVATRLQALGAVASSGAGWERPFVEGLASLHLLIAAHGRLDQLPEDTQHDVRATLGLTVTNDEVLARPPVHDLWQAVSHEVTVEDKLRVSRTWLFGTNTRRVALVLAFAHGTQPLSTVFRAGMACEADLCFFPGHAPRAVAKSVGTPERITAVAGVDTLDQLCDLSSQLAASHPWLGEIAVPVRELVPVRTDAGLMLVDRENRSLPATCPELPMWSLLAVSGGHPVDVAVGFDGSRVRPLAVMHGGSFTPLTTAEGTAP